MAIQIRSKRKDFRDDSWGGQLWDRMQNVRTRLTRRAWFNEVNEALGGLELPAKLPKAYQDILVEILDEDFRRNLRTEIRGTLLAFKNNVAGWSTQEEIAAMRAQLEAFVGETWTTATTSLPGALPDVPLNLDDKLKDAIIQTIREAPDLVLCAVKRALDMFPNSLSVDFVAIRAALADVANAGSCATMLDNPNRLDNIDLTGKIAKGVAKAYAFAQEHLPRDASATGTVVGEGAGTELAGHPVRWAPLWIGSVFELIATACEKYVENYDQCVLRDTRDRVMQLQAEAASGS